MTSAVQSSQLVAPALTKRFFSSLDQRHADDLYFVCIMHSTKDRTHGINQNIALLSKQFPVQRNNL